MWRGGARGNRVSPDPDLDFFNDGNATELAQAESGGGGSGGFTAAAGGAGLAAGAATTALLAAGSSDSRSQTPQENQEPSPEPEGIYEENTEEPEPPPPLTPSPPEYSPEHQPAWVYERNRKTYEDNPSLEQYLDRRFNKRQAWTPYLWIRRRDKLYAGPVKPVRGWAGWKYRQKMRWKSFKVWWSDTFYKLTLWRGWFKKIEGHQGTGVLSYFIFLKWLFFLNIFIFLLMFWVVVFFQVSFDDQDWSKDVTGSDDSANLASVQLAETCKAQYEVNVSSDALQRILDFIQGTGWMEKTAMFYGYYSNTEVQLAVSDYNMPLAYFLVTIIIFLLSLFVMVRHTVNSFREAVLANQEKKGVKKVVFCNHVFTSWDYTLAEEESIKIKQKSIHYMLSSELSEVEYEKRRQNRTTGEKCKLFTIRFLVNFVVIVLLVGAGAAIYFAQDYSSDFTTSSDVGNYHSLVVLLVEFLPSLVITILNAGLPLLFEVLVGFEQYRPAFVLKISLVRTVFLRLASVAMIIATLYLQVTCSTQDSCLVGTGDCPSIQCWETFFGQSMYKLAVTHFIVEIFVTLGYELPRKLVTTKCNCGLFKKIGPAVFDIPKTVLDLVYAQTLCWLAFFFAPMVTAIHVGMFFVVFYLKVLSAMYNTVPAEKPYAASRSNTFFMIILMVAFFLCCIPVGYVLASMQPSPMCGPFRIYSYPYEIITVGVNNAPSGFQTFWDIITSPAFVASLIILLCLALYYCSALRSAHKGMVHSMREQLILEGKDKQFLLAKIAELTGQSQGGSNKGGGRGGAPPPFQPKVTTVNETPNNKELEQERWLREQREEEKRKNQQNGDVGIEDIDHPPPPAYYNPFVATVTTDDEIKREATNQRLPPPTVQTPETISLRGSPELNPANQNQGNNTQETAIQQPKNELNAANPNQGDNTQDAVIQQSDVPDSAAPAGSLTEEPVRHRKRKKSSKKKKKKEKTVEPPPNLSDAFW